jgi:GntR family transcriptional regulator/MocR family aminotransferase
LRIGSFAACHRGVAVPPWGVPEQLPYGEAVPRQYAASGSLLTFRLEPDDGQPVYARLYAQLREAILTGRVEAGTRLPASRVLAAELGVSRNTVVAAYTRLTDEGYAHARGGAGVYVASVLPEDAAFAALASPDALETMPPVLSARGRQLAAMGLEEGSACPVPFVADVPAFDVFPLESWIRLMARSWRQVQPDMLGYAPAAGHAPLREVIAQNLRATRFLRAAGSDVIMTSGSQQSLDLLARVLLDPGESVWVEEPGYAGGRSAFTAAGARLVPVPVDAEGLSVQEGRRRDPSPRLIFVTPSHQYPLGVTMSMARRVELLAFAQSCGALVVEDDYDSEFRYAGTTLPALQSMDRAGRVFYLGTFSKSLLPTFRLGVLVPPPAYAAVFASAKSVIDRHPPLLEQVTLLSFMRSGQFAAHIRRMRRIYRERQTVLVEEITRQMGEVLHMEPSDAGVHLIGTLKDGRDDRAFCAGARACGILLRPLSDTYLGPPARQGVLFGFAAIPPRRIVAAVGRLAAYAQNNGSGASMTGQPRRAGSVGPAA